ncbi:MAG: HdeD family acid-resistance protein [Alphaproteobacteria bacterium]
MNALAVTWRVFMLRGAVAALCGMFFLFGPELGLMLVFRLFLGVRMAIDGACSIYQAARGGHPADQASRIWLLVDGFISLIAASGMLFAPGFSSVWLLIVTAAWFLLTGAARLVLALRLSSVLLGLLGAVNIVMSVWILFPPGLETLLLFRMVGLEAIIMASIMILLGWRLRKIYRKPYQEAGQPRI